MQVHDAFIVGPAVYRFGVALQATAGQWPAADAIAAGAALRATCLTNRAVNVPAL